MGTADEKEEETRRTSVLRSRQLREVPSLPPWGWGLHLKGTHMGSGPHSRPLASLSPRCPVLLRRPFACGHVAPVTLALTVHPSPPLLPPG